MDCWCELAAWANTPPNWSLIQPALLAFVGAPNTCGFPSGIGQEATKWWVKQVTRFKTKQNVHNLCFFSHAHVRKNLMNKWW